MNAALTQAVFSLSVNLFFSYSEGKKMPNVYIETSKEDDEELTVFEAPDYIADQIYGMEPGQITSISGLAGDHVWEDFTFSERQALDRFVEALVIGERVPLERVGFDDEGQNLYQKMIF